MNNFKTLIMNYEHDKENTYEIKKGNLPVILISAHGITQKKRNGKIKFAEPYTRGIMKYVGKKTDCYTLVKNADTGIDPNKDNDDEFKAFLVEIIKKNNIKLAIDLHGAKRDRDFDVEIGTCNGKMVSDKRTDKLIKHLNENGIKNISIDDPFKGGFISKTIHEKTGIDCIQLEINRNYRDLRKIRNLNRICRSLVSYVKDY